MKKNNVKNFLTFPYEEVFCDHVYVDIKSGVIYDKAMGVVIAYINMSLTHMVIKFVLPKVLDNNYDEVRISLRDYFNAENVVVRPISEYYFRVSNGYIYLGHPCKDTNYQIRLPRLYDPDDATNTSETSDAAIEVIDEELDFIDPDEFAANGDDMIES